MANSITVRINGVSEVIDALASLPERISAGLEASRDLLEEGVLTAIEGLYEPPRAPYFLVLSESVPVGQVLASVTAYCDEVKVLWWEYGTKAHVIAAGAPSASRPNPMLRFEGGDGMIIFRKMVNNPGIVAHEQRIPLQAEMTDLADSLWRAAVTSAVQTLAAP